MNIEEILNRFEKTKPNGYGKWLACCPAHDDQSPSLSIRLEGEKILLYCFVGCKVSDIAHAVGLELRDLYANNHSLKSFTEAEKFRYEQQRQDEIAAKQAIAANKAKYIWQNSKPAIDHPYLTKKCIKPHGTRISRTGDLVIPMLNERLELVSLQFIKPEKIDGRDKTMLPGGQTKGCFWWLGSKTERVLIGEGFATCATLFEATGFNTWIAFSSFNLINVARFVRSKRPDAEIIICADNDASGAGERCANEAALSVDGLICMPPSVGCDFNDLALSSDERG